MCVCVDVQICSSSALPVTHHHQPSPITTNERHEVSIMKSRHFPNRFHSIHCGTFTLLCSFLVTSIISYYTFYNGSVFCFIRLSVCLFPTAHMKPTPNFCSYCYWSSHDHDSLSSYQIHQIVGRHFRLSITFHCMHFTSNKSHTEVPRCFLCVSLATVCTRTANTMTVGRQCNLSVSGHLSAHYLFRKLK